MLRLQALRDQLRTSLWFVPAIFAVAAVVLAFVLLAVDDELSRDPGGLFFLFGGTAEGARSVLSTIAQSMLTFTGLVFTITMLVLQLASSQLSPRVTRTFLRDRGNQTVLGLFVATFVYTLIVLRDVRSPTGDDDGFVPGLSIWFAFALLLASVAAFIYYIDHMAHAIRASTVIANIATETEAAVDRLYPERVGRDVREHDRDEQIDLGRPAVELRSPRAGVLVGLDEQSLLETVSTGDRRLELVPAVGDFVPAGAPLARLWGSWDRDAGDDVRDAISFGDERTLEQDAAFGFRQLVDVAVRALSPGTNDPTTAIQAVDRLHDLLRRLGERDIPSPVRTDDDGVVRLILPRPGWDDYVQLALDEIRRAGETQIQVVRRLRHLLEDLLSMVPADRQPTIRRQLGLLEDAVDRTYSTAERGVAAAPSARGHSHPVRPDDRWSRR